MKKILIVAAMVIGLLMAGEARADGAWVLWATNGTKVEWQLQSAWPSHFICTKAQYVLYDGTSEKIRSDTDYSGPSSLFMITSERPWWILIEVKVNKILTELNALQGTKIVPYPNWSIEFKCLPESVDPRK